MAAFILLILVVLACALVPSVVRKFGLYRGRSFEYWIQKCDQADYRSRREGIRVLLDAVRDENAETRYRAVNSLSRLGVPPREALTELSEIMLHDQDAKIRAEITTVLRLIGSQAVPALLDGLSDPDPEVRVYARAALVQMVVERREVPILSKALDNKNSRNVAIVVLGKMGTQAKEAVPNLEKFLDDKELGIRTRAAEALWSIDGRLGKTVLVLIDGIEHGDEPERVVDIRCIGEMGAKAKAALPCLIKAMQDDYYLVRREAAKALGKMGPSAKDAVPALRRALNDSDGTVREDAATALTQIQE